jgi:hypothetical protein
MRISPNTEPPPPSQIRFTKASRSNSLLGGGAPAYTSTAGGVLGARAPLDTVPITIEGRPSRFLIAGFLSVISTTVSGQIGFLSSPRSCRKKPCRIWYTVARPWAPSSQQPWHPRRSASAELSQGRRRSPDHPFIDRRPRLERGYPFVFIKIRASKKEPTT